MNRLLHDLFINRRLQRESHHLSLDTRSAPGLGPDAGFQEACNLGESVGPGTAQEVGAGEGGPK